MIALALFGCNGVEPLPDTADTDTDVIVDTDPDVGEWSDADLAPDGITVGVGAVVRFSLRATDATGARATPTGVTWTVSDGAVARVEDGVVTAIAAGNTQVNAAWGEYRASATLRVDGTDTIEITVTDDAGRPLHLASAQVGGTPVPRTDEQGRTAGTTGAGPASVCAWDDDYVPLCATGLVGRRVTLALRPRPGAEVPFVSGTVDFSQVDTSGAPQSLVVGIVAPSRPGDPRFHPLEDVLGPPRLVSGFGIDVELPSNVVVKDKVETFTAPGPAGDRTVWTIVTLVPILDALAAGSGSEDPLAVLGRNMGNAVRTTTEATLPESGGVDGGVIAPSAPLDVPIVVTTGPLPEGAAGDEVPVLVAYHDAGKGVVVDGIAAGLGAVTLGSGGDATDVFALVQQGALGEGGVEVYVAAAVEDGAVALPPWPAFPVLPTFRAPVTLSISARGDLVRMTGVDPQGRLRDVIAPAGDHDLELPVIDPPFDRGVVTWDTWAVTTDRGHYEEFARTGAYGEAALAPITLGTARASGDVYASQ